MKPCGRANESTLGVITVCKVILNCAKLKNILKDYHVPEIYTICLSFIFNLQSTFICKETYKIFTA